MHGVNKNVLFQSLTKCYNLRVLDIAANELRIFPTEVCILPNTQTLLFGYTVTDIM